MNVIYLITMRVPGSNHSLPLLLILLALYLLPIHASAGSTWTRWHDNDVFETECIQFWTLITISSGSGSDSGYSLQSYKTSMGIAEAVTE